MGRRRLLLGERNQPASAGEVGKSESNQTGASPKLTIVEPLRTARRDRDRYNRQDALGREDSGQVSSEETWGPADPVPDQGVSGPCFRDAFPRSGGLNAAGGCGDGRESVGGGSATLRKCLHDSVEGDQDWNCRRQV